MRVGKECLDCLYQSQIRRCVDREEALSERYLERVRQVLHNRKEEDSAPYLVDCFDRVFRDVFGELPSYATIKREFNDFVLGMEAELKVMFESAPDPLLAALLAARAGNYIDFGTLKRVEKSELLKLLREVTPSQADCLAYERLIKECEKARSFLLIADNCGEIVLDKLFLLQLKKRFPQLELRAMVRGAETLNDVTTEDALQVGLDEVAEVIPNGNTVAGTVESLLSAEALRILNESDVILAKGQGNYETLSGNGRHVFYAFLCKCKHFTDRLFHVPILTGMLVEES